MSAAECREALEAIARDALGKAYIHGLVSMVHAGPEGAPLGYPDQVAATDRILKGADVYASATAVEDHEAATRVRTCQRSYVQDGHRAGQVQRVHVVREHGPKDRDGQHTLCGQHTHAVRQSEGIIRDAPHDLPDGLSWCPTCVGRLAEQQGRTAEIAALLGLVAR